MTIRAPRAPAHWRGRKVRIGKTSTKGRSTFRLPLTLPPLPNPLSRASNCQPYTEMTDRVRLSTNSPSSTCRTQKYNWSAVLSSTRNWCLVRTTSIMSSWSSSTRGKSTKIFMKLVGRSNIRSSIALYQLPRWRRPCTATRLEWPLETWQGSNLAIDTRMHHILQG